MTKLLHPSKPVLSLLLSLCFSFTVFSQSDASRRIVRLQNDPAVATFELNDRTKLISSLQFKSSSKIPANNAKEIVADYFELDRPGIQLQTKQSTNTGANVVIERFTMTYQGIPVEHSAFVVLSSGGFIRAITAEPYVFDAAFTVQPSLSEQGALQKALDFVRASRYAWDALEQDKQTASGNLSLQSQLEDLRQQYLPHGELVIAKNVYGDLQPRLAWKFDIYAIEPLSRAYIYIDAINGKLLLRDMIIKHVGNNTEHSGQKALGTMEGKAPFTNYIAPGKDESPRISSSETGIAHTRYSGIRNIYTTRVNVPVLGTPDPNAPSFQLSYSGSDPRVPILTPEQVFILKDDTRGQGVETYDMNGVGGLPLSLPGLHAQSLAFVDRDVLAGSKNVWRNETLPGTLEDHVRGATSNGTVGTDEALNDDIALDAHWGAEMVYDYWKNRHNRFSFDNKNSAIKSYVHYGPAYDNAFWNGSVMTYGDGSGVSLPIGFRPLTSLDVCGHEIGHGICSFTSDLIYESESGAMNEAFSDIWAAAIERYVITNVDPSLASTYRPFFIGEQISADPNSPLRRMDAPKEQGNPDTYGGDNWENPVCTPTLVNDQCGVHTNSGVLNKWFYLLTVGSHNGSGPDAAYVIPGADDGMRDDGATPNAIAYAVTGLGFDKSEPITYLTELLLTPTATYAQARTASITAARILFGECSAEEISVTNAWNGVGVGAAYAGCSAPLLAATALQTDVRETAGGTDCVRYNEYNINVNLTAAQASPVIINISVNTGATTMMPDEYSLSTSSVTYNIGESGLRTVKLRIYDDAMVETDETVTIDVTSTSPVMNESIVFTVRNDDVLPNIGGTTTLLNENFESTPTNGLPPGWTSIDKITPSSVKWEVETYQAGALTWAGKRAIIELTATSPSTDGIAAYSIVPGGAAQNILSTPMINAAGLNRIRVQFVYNAGGEPACEPACDYGQLVYSYDGITFAPFTDSAAVMYLQPTDATYDYTLPASFNGKQFYLGILWNNDDNAGTALSITIDDFVVTGRGTDIENELGDAVTEKVNAETGKPTYFYSTADGELIASITNSTPHNYGCITTTVEKAGNAGFELYFDGVNKHRVADKFIRITPTTNNPSGAYQVTLYFSEAQIAALEAYTALPRTAFYIYKTSALSYTGATAANTVRVPATYTAIPGYGGSFTASFTTGFSGFALGASVSIVLPVTCVDFRATRSTGGINLQWKVAQDQAGQVYELQRSADGSNFNTIKTVPATSVNNGSYSSFDAIGGYQHLYYRLKQTDVTGEARFLCTILRVSADNGGFSISHVYPNPGRDEAAVNVVTDRAVRLQIEIVNVKGQIVSKQTSGVFPGSIRVPIDINKLSPGSYWIRFRNDEGDLLGVEKFVKIK